MLLALPVWGAVYRSLSVQQATPTWIKIFVQPFMPGLTLEAKSLKRKCVWLVIPPIKTHHTIKAYEYKTLIKGREKTEGQSFFFGLIFTCKMAI